MKRMSAIAVALLILAGHPEADAALRDRATLPPDVAVNTVYLSLEDCPPTKRDELENALRFIVPSLSSKVYLADQIPLRIEKTNLLRLDLAGLGWESTYPTVIAQQYVPSYRPDLVHAKAIPLVVSGLWFAATVVDPIEGGNAGDLLLYGGKPPATADDFLKFWGIQNDADFVFGMIEGQSGVSLQRIRLIENRPGAKRNVGWLTRDSAVVAADHDPLETLPNKVKFDAQEIIVQQVKWAGGRSGYLQSYFLANGAGKAQVKAPANIVVDHIGLRGPEIRNTFSCIVCHTQGINPPTNDQFRSYIEAGAKVAFLKKDEQRRVDQYLTSDVAREVVDCQAQYAAGIRLCNGLSPEDNQRCFVESIQTFDQDVTLAQAARELYCEPRDLSLALAYYSRTQTLTGRLALLAQGQAISRNQWKTSYQFAQGILYQWQTHTP